MTPETEGKKTCFVMMVFGEKTDFEQVLTPMQPEARHDLQTSTNPDIRDRA